MPYFVFLEFTDPKVRGFLNSLQESLSRDATQKAVHITVRGPYETPPELALLEQLSEALRGYGVVIGGVGTFKTKKGYAVYLRVQSKVFSDTDIWWKPDFKEDGINPHVTIFETTDQLAAMKVENFLRSERIEIFTLNFTLTVYTSKQLNLFETNVEPELGRRRSYLERWKVKSGIFQRAALLRDQLDESIGGIV